MNGKYSLNGNQQQTYAVQKPCIYFLTQNWKQNFIPIEL